MTIERDPGHDRPLAGRVALVTGASRGLGRAMAIALAAAGARVAVTGRDEAALAATMSALPPGSESSSFALDITDGAAVGDFASRLWSS